jgi:hypothetical protein
MVLAVFFGVENVLKIPEVYFPKTQEFHDMPFCSISVNTPGYEVVLGSQSELQALYLPWGGNICTAQPGMAKSRAEESLDFSHSSISLGPSPASQKYLLGDPRHILPPAASSTVIRLTVAF